MPLGEVGQARAEISDHRQLKRAIREAVAANSHCYASFEQTFALRRQKAQRGGNTQVERDTWVRCATTSDALCSKRHGNDVRMQHLFHTIPPTSDDKRNEPKIGEISGRSAEASHLNSARRERREECEKNREALGRT